MFNLFKRKDMTEYLNKELKLRQVDAYKFTIKFVDGTNVEFYNGYCRYGKYINGVESYKQLKIVYETIEIDDITYNLNNAISIEHEHLETKYIKTEYIKTIKPYKIDSIFNVKEDNLEEEL